MSSVCASRAWPGGGAESAGGFPHLKGRYHIASILENFYSIQVRQTAVALGVHLECGRSLSVCVCVCVSVRIRKLLLLLLVSVCVCVSRGAAFWGTWQLSHPRHSGRRSPTTRLGAAPAALSVHTTGTLSRTRRPCRCSARFVRQRPPARRPPRSRARPRRRRAHWPSRGAEQERCLRASREER